MSRYEDFDDEYEDEEVDYSEYEDYDRYERIPKRRPVKNKKKHKVRNIMIALVAFEIIVELVLIIAIKFYNIINAIDYVAIDRAAVSVNPDLKEKTQEVLQGYQNILLLGSDTRTNTLESLNTLGENNTDAILVCSINKDTKEVRLISIYRDTMLQMKDVLDEGSSPIYNKATECMLRYGAEATMSMINTNLDLDVSDYIMVNWDALIEIIDLVGGVELEITEDEQYWINEYLRDTGLNTHRSYDNVDSYGMVHLDGIQATAYCRIRYTKTGIESDTEDGRTDSDFGRTLRQRTVINLVVQKAKKIGITDIWSNVEAILENVSTSFSPDDLKDMAMELNSYNFTQSTGFPFSMKNAIDYVKVDGLSEPVHDPLAAEDFAGNVKEFHKFLFDATDYEPSSTVQKIGDTLAGLNYVYYN